MDSESTICLWLDHSTLGAVSSLARFRTKSRGAQFPNQTLWILATPTVIMLLPLWIVRRPTQTGDSSTGHSFLRSYSYCSVVLFQRRCNSCKSSGLSALLLHDLRPVATIMGLKIRAISATKSKSRSSRGPTATRSRRRTGRPPNTTGNLHNWGR